MGCKTSDILERLTRLENRFDADVKSAVIEEPDNDPTDPNLDEDIDSDIEKEPTLKVIPRFFHSASYCPGQEYDNQYNLCHRVRRQAKSRMIQRRQQEQVEECDLHRLLSLLKEYGKKARDPLSEPQYIRYTDFHDVLRRLLEASDASENATMMSKFGWLLTTNPLQNLNERRTDIFPSYLSSPTLCGK